MTAQQDLDAIELRLLDMAKKIPGACILAAGTAAGGWIEQARHAAPLFRFEPVNDQSTIARTLSDLDIRHVYILRYCGPGLARNLAELDTLLVHQRIDVVLFSEVGAEWSRIAEILLTRGYELFGILAEEGGLEPLDRTADSAGFARFVAVQQRVVDLVLYGIPRELDLPVLLDTHKVQVRGLVHLGAHQGQELALYRRIGWFPIALIEAHPEIYQQLAASTAGHPDVLAVHAAICERDGPVTLHLSLNDQSSSVLPINRLAKLVGKTAECGTIEVPGRDLDSLFAEWRAEGAAIAGANVLVSDIQGAELLALRGAKHTLAQFDAMVLELSFDELYLGCPQVEEIDEFMDAAGFARLATVATWNPSWSDAFYRRRVSQQ
jgi:FkbM family methyltransferase